MNIVADLHVHSTASDGVLSPTLLAQAARQAGLSAIALTDHDTIHGVAEAMTAGESCGLQVFPGIEFSCGWEDSDLSLHVLGLFIDPRHPELLRVLQDQQASRFSRALRILDKLEALKINVKPLRHEFEGHPDKLLGRPHIARYLAETGVVSDFQQAFDRYLKRGRPAHVPKDHLLPQTAVELTHKAGGLAFVAHPGLISHWDEVWNMIKSLPWDGLEVFYSEHEIHTLTYFREFARKHDFLMSGGSDYHGEYGKHANRLGHHGLDQPTFDHFLSSAHTRRHAWKSAQS
jgi:hypothetical protein